MRLATMLAAFCLVFAAFGQTSEAALVKFKGVIENGAGGVLGGPASLPLNFILQFEVQPGALPGFGSVTANSGSFRVDPTGLNLNYGITGGTVILTNGAVPAPDEATFLVGVGGPEAANLIFTFSGPGSTIASNVINQSNMSAITSIPGSFNFVYDGPGAFDYSGSVQAVPEPGSMAALAALTLGGAGYGWRRRKNAKKAQA